MSQNWPYPGSRWWKFDFHTHTPESKDTPWHGLRDQEGALTPEAWLLKYMAAGIDCVAITDHNSGAWIDKLKSAYASMRANPPEGFRDLYLFPGVEISVHGGFHLLAIFSPESATSDIDTLLGAVKYQGTKGDSDGVTREGALVVIQAILDANGLPIPAHADADKGLLQLESGGTAKPRLDANTIEQVLDSTGILAMEFINEQAPKPTIYAQRKLCWTEVLGSDCHNFRVSYQNVPGSRYTWVKMASPTLEGLRLALLDGNGISIRRSDEVAFNPFQTPEHFIKSVEISEARVMGRRSPASLIFSPYFNALVGGRGTGKSTVVHALRLAFGRHEELKRLEERSEPRQTFEQFAKLSRNRDDRGGLRGDTSITIELMRDDFSHRLTWQQSNQNIIVEEYEDGWKQSISQDISAQRFPVRIFSQGQIAAMAGENTQALLDIIDHAAETKSAMDALDEAKRIYFTQLAKQRELKGKLKARAELQRQFQDAERKLKSFEQAHHADVLKAFQRTRQQDQIVQNQIQAAIDIAQRTERLAQTITLESFSQAEFDEQVDGDILAIISTLQKRFTETSIAVNAAAKQLSDNTDILRRDPRYISWWKRTGEAKQGYEQLKEQLQAQGVNDPKEYDRWIQEKQRLESELKKLDLIQQESDELTEKYSAQWQAIVHARNLITEKRQKFLNEVLAQNDFVRIELIPFGSDVRDVERSLRQLLGAESKYEEDIYTEQPGSAAKGLIADWYRERSGATELHETLNALKRRLVAACQGKGNFGSWFNKYLAGQTEKRPELIDYIVCWFPDDGLTVRYSRQGDGQKFEPIGQASAGQRAAAMLAFLLAHGDEPLILDQPEDDLDNHLIYELVVRQIRENKLRRQLIIVTHNPNIVVNGDAELVFTLDYNGQCYVRTNGSLQEQEVRGQVCRVMEGGREAFSRRWHRLGREI
jgi:hypothetical protein